MRKRKTLVFLGITVALGLSILGGLSKNRFNPLVPTSAQQSQSNPFELINQQAKANKTAPTFAKTQEIADLLIEHLSVLDIPAVMRTPITEQIANASLNGNSTIDENNIVNAVNNLASSSAAPSYAYTNAEQVKVVRMFLHGLMPDVVSISGNMTDLEAFAVFIATLSQKVDNDAFMVTPAEFTASMNTPASQPFPGTSGAVTQNAEIGQQSAKAAEMLGVVDNYANSKDRLASEDIVSSIGIY